MFNAIRKQVEEATQSKQAPIPDTSYVGKLVSSPGTENTVISLKNIELMKCMAAGDLKKLRCCVVLKNPPKRYPNEFIDSNGNAVEVIKQRVFDELQVVLTDVGRRIKSLERELERVTSERDAYKLSIDTLRNNGVID